MVSKFWVFRSTGRTKLVSSSDFENIFFLFFQIKETFTNRFFASFFRVTFGFFGRTELVSSSDFLFYFSFVFFSLLTTFSSILGSSVLGFLLETLWLGGSWTKFQGIHFEIIFFFCIFNETFTNVSLLFL